MNKCGICLLHNESNKCCVCNVHICAKCIGFMPRYIKGAYCKWCYLSVLEHFTQWFCTGCDKCIEYENYVQIRNRCKECNTNGASRLILPHYKARPVIEIQFIPDIAKLIFDYYYTPRRYFKGEE